MSQAARSELSIVSQLPPHLSPDEIAALPPADKANYFRSFSQGRLAMLGAVQGLFKAIPTRRSPYDHAAVGSYDVIQSNRDPIPLGVIDLGELGEQPIVPAGLAVSAHILLARNATKSVSGGQGKPVRVQYRGHEPVYLGARLFEQRENSRRTGQSVGGFNVIGLPRDEVLAHNLDDDVVIKSGAPDQWELRRMTALATIIDIALEQSRPETVT
jgi:hypothetical protein